MKYNLKDIIYEYIKTGKVTFTDEEIANFLYDICDSFHSSCNSECPIYDVFKNDTDIFDKSGNCKYHKNGVKMSKALKYKIQKCWKSQEDQ